LKFRAKYSSFFDSQCVGNDFALLELEEDVPASIANHIVNYIINRY